MTFTFRSEGTPSLSVVHLQLLCRGQEIIYFGRHHNDNNTNSVYRRVKHQSVLVMFQQCL